MLVSPDHRVRLSDQHRVAVAPELEAVFVGAAAAAASPASATVATTSGGIFFTALELTGAPMNVTIANVRNSGATFDIVITYGTLVETYRGIQLAGTAAQLPDAVIDGASALVRVAPAAAGWGMAITAQQISMSYAASPALAAAEQLGFVPAPGDTSLTGLPLAFSSTAAFAAAFPGDDSWLARAVRDYFNAGGLRAWVVRVEVNPAAPLDAYVTQNPPIAAAPPTNGIEIAMEVPSAGLLLLPDLEYLCLTAALPPPTPPSAPPVPPGFRPLADFVRPPPTVTAQPPSTMPVAPYDVLGRVSAALASGRPDMLCLFALPVGADQTQSVPALVQRADAYLHGDAQPGPDLPQVQAFAPLLRDADAGGEIASPSGVVAGVLAAAAQTDGLWRSIAGRTLPLGSTPVRRIESNALNELRRSGVAALRFASGGTTLDDDILACRDGPGSARRRSAGTRRLMGWLLRSLQTFGEQLVFENVLDDGRVELILTNLFTALLKRGALNGRQITDAVTITRRIAAEDNAIEFDIAVAAAVAVETIRLRFLDGELTTTLGAAP